MNLGLLAPIASVCTLCPCAGYFWINGIISKFEIHSLSSMTEPNTPDNGYLTFNYLYRSIPLWTMPPWAPVLASLNDGLFPLEVAFSCGTFHSNKKQNRTYVGTECVVLLWWKWPCWFCGEDCGSIWNFGLERALNVQSLMRCCGNLEDNAESNENDGDLTCDISERHLKIPQVLWDHLVFGAKNLWKWNLILLVQTMPVSWGWTLIKRPTLTKF